MKKFFKILAISLTSIIILALVAVAVVIWMVLTPKRLTPILQKQADRYITCPYNIGEVELTFFSTFPQFGLRANDVELINPMEGAPCDTIAKMDNLVATIDLSRLWESRAIQFDQFYLTNLDACIFINEEGKTNFDVFYLGPQEENPEPSDFRFGAVEIHNLKIKDCNLTYLDLVNKMSGKIEHFSSKIHLDADENKSNEIDNDGKTWSDIIPYEKVNLRDFYFEASRAEYQADSLQINAEIQDLTINLDMDLDGAVAEGQLAVSAPKSFVQYAGDTYLKDDNLSIKAPFGFWADSMKVEVDKGRVSLNQFDIAVDGNVSLPENGDIVTDVNVAFEKWKVKEILAELPSSITKMLTDLEVKGVLSADVKAKGIYNETSFPVILANASLTNGEVDYVGFPYHLSKVLADVQALVDMNSESNSYVYINRLKAETPRSSIDAHGSLLNILSDINADVSAKVKLDLPEVSSLLPDSLNCDLKGKLTGNLQAKLKMSQLEKMELDKMSISGDVDFSDLDVVYADMQVLSDKGNLKVQLPNKKSSDKSLSFVKLDGDFNSLYFTQGDSTLVNGKAIKATLETSKLIDNQPISVNCKLNTDKLNLAYTNMRANVDASNIEAYMKVNPSDENYTPTLRGNFELVDTKASMDSMQVELQNPRGAFQIEPQGSNNSGLQVKLDFNDNKLFFANGESLQLSTNEIGLNLAMKENPDKEDFLVKWNPIVKVKLNDGNVDLGGFKEFIKIPAINFDYNNQEFDIHSSKIILGNSDFSLKGKIQNIGEWLDNTGLLEGELDFVSDNTDFNEIIDLTSGLGQSPDAENSTESIMSTEVENAEDDPFIVPRGVDLVLNTQINNAVLGEQTMRNLGGRLHIKDGVLVLEEMGFISRAAKMQLTGIYRTPRRNHLYLGLDFHMTNIQIEELIKMVPEIDTILPMMTSFKGKAEFHFAVETYMKSNYDFKMSTLRGAASVAGQDLVLLDGETFSEIAKKLMFKKKTENLVDSISAEMTIFRNEVDIYPFCLQIDKYKAALGGRHNLDMTFDYHISLLKPLRIGLNVVGNIDDFKFKLAKCKYAQDFQPARRNVVETQNMQLREVIRTALKKSMKE